jgi:hypothetical protein
MPHACHPSLHVCTSTCVPPACLPVLLHRTLLHDTSAGGCAVVLVPSPFSVALPTPPGGPPVHNIRQTSEFGLQFSTVGWKQYLTALKSIGLASLLSSRIERP